LRYETISSDPLPAQHTIIFFLLSSSFSPIGICRKVREELKTRRKESEMDREELLKKLADQKLAYYQSIGLAPFKSGQLVSESLESWQKMPTEKLEELLETPVY
jgi:hypothetical protein